ncbi:UNVERIFIED_CONTAM: Copia protein [Sesamum radiatum]|uniref:Copia protein n=1 Tax=Sesamum radiatum TaxID=300843 RepID=A0AAW2VMK7_SESRA
MLVQYETTTHKFEPAVLVGEASTSKAKGKGARRWKRKNDKGTAVTATASTRGFPPAAPKRKGKGKVGGSQRSKANDVCMHCQGKGLEKGSVYNSSPTLVLQRSRRLSKDEMILRLSDGKAVAAEAVGSLRLVVSSHIRIDLKDVYFVPKNGILSQWTPPGTPQLNGVAERRNQTLLDMVRSMMSFTELPPSFWGYALETTAKLLNIAPSKFIGYSKETAGYYFYDPAEQKVFVSRNAVFLEKGFSSDNRHDEVLIEESSEKPQHDSTISFEPTVHIDRFQSSVRQLENLEYLIGTDSLMAKEYTQRPGVDFEETYSPVAMAKSIRILLAIEAWYDYEICQIDVKTAFLNGFVEEEIFMDHPEGFTVVGEEQKVCLLQRSIYGLKQASRS